MKDKSEIFHLLARVTLKLCMAWRKIEKKIKNISFSFYLSVAILCQQPLVITLGCGLTV